MWPDISPARGACRSFIFSLISECPVFHITGTPPAAWIAVGNACEHLTSKMIDWPLPFSREHVPCVQDQEVVAPHDLAALVDDADSIRVAIEPDPDVRSLAAHRGDQVLEILDDGRIGMVVGERAVALRKQIRGVSPSRGNSRPDQRPRTVAAVETTLKAAATGSHAATTSRCIDRSRPRSGHRPRPTRIAPTRVHDRAKRSIRSPYSDSVPTQSLKPLYSGGLCEPVIWMPRYDRIVVQLQYRTGVGTTPMSTYTARPTR